MTEPAIYFNYKKFLEVFDQPEVETLKFMFERLGGSPAIDSDLGTVSSDVVIIKNEQSEAGVGSMSVSRLQKKISMLESEIDSIRTEYIAIIKRLQYRVNQLESQL